MTILYVLNTIYCSITIPVRSVPSSSSSSAMISPLQSEGLLKLVSNMSVLLLPCDDEIHAWAWYRWHHDLITDHSISASTFSALNMWCVCSPPPPPRQQIRVYLCSFPSPGPLYLGEFNITIYSLSWICKGLIFALLQQQIPFLGLSRQILSVANAPHTLARKWEHACGDFCHFSSGGGGCGGVWFTCLSHVFASYSFLGLVMLFWYRPMLFDSVCFLYPPLILCLSVEFEYLDIPCWQCRASSRFLFCFFFFFFLGGGGYIIDPFIIADTINWLNGLFLITTDYHVLSSLLMVLFKIVT